MGFKLKLNIRGQLTLQFLMLVGFLFMFFSVSVYFFSKLYLEKRFYKKLQDRAITTSALFFDFQANNKAIRKIVENTEKEYLTQEIISIIDIKRDLFVFSTSFRNEEFHRLLLKKIDSLQTFGTSNLGAYKMAFLKIKDASGDYWVLVSAKDTVGAEALDDLRKILLIMLLVALLLIGFMGWYLANSAFSPISGIINQLGRIFPKNISKRIELSNFEDEIGQLANTINQLLERVENSVFTQKMFVANISHELKNPLTKIFTQIELLEMKYKDNAELYPQIKGLREDTLKLNHLTQSILQLANVFSDESALPMEKIRIDELLFDSISDYKKWNPANTVEVAWEQVPEEDNLLIINGNEDALKVVFKNLIDNACKFSDNQEAKILIFPHNDFLDIKISNLGTPIPVEESLKIFQPFFRSNATAKGKSGHGVGLAIVKQIVDLHKGKLTVEPNPSGNTFSVLFYIIKS
jgi:signal transduction histidine kinase